MREIKFRGLTKESNTWEYGDLIRNKNNDCFIHFYDCNGFECSYEVYPETVSQYTGLKDKNGKKIYEVDIIEGGYLNPLTSEFLSRKYVIEYDKGSFKGKLIGHTPYGDTWLQFIEGEVISSIYENKDLLEGEK